MTQRVPLWALAGGVFALIAVVLVTIAIIGDDTLPDRAGPPIEELAVEKTKLEPNKIELTLRNTGPDEVQLAQVFVADAYVDFQGAEEPIGRLESETITIDFPWQDGQPYLVSMLTSTGLVIDHEIDAAVETPDTDGDLFALMALLGLYVGVIPVALGMLLLAGDEAVPADLDPSRHGGDRRPPRLPRRRREPRRASRSPASRAAPSAVPSWCCSARASPSWP